MSVLLGSSQLMDLLITLYRLYLHSLTQHAPYLREFLHPKFLQNICNLTSYSHWRGEWGLVSYMIVMSMTVGQTNSSGLLR